MKFSGFHSDKKMRFLTTKRAECTNNREIMQIIMTEVFWSYFSNKCKHKIARAAFDM